MTSKTFVEALRDAGLDDDSLRLIGENQTLAELVAKSAVPIAKGVCDKFRAAFGEELPRPVHVLQGSKYKGRIKLNRIPEIADALRTQNRRPTQVLIAEELGCTPGMLSKLKDRFPDVRQMLRAALDDFLAPKGGLP